MRIEKTFKNLTTHFEYFESLTNKELKKELKNISSNPIKNFRINLETYGSVVELTLTYNWFNSKCKETYLICEIGEEEDDDVKLAKALRIIYERFAEQVVNNVLIEN